MLCTCGAANPEQAKYCYRCGAQIVYQFQNPGGHLPERSGRSGGGNSGSQWAGTYEAPTQPKARHPVLKLLWPKTDSITVAISVARQGAIACFVVAAITGVLALVSISSRQQIIGLNGWSLIDAALFAIAGLRILRLSRTWSIVGLVLYLAEAGFRLSQGQFSGIVVMIILIIALINGVRGTFAYHHLYEEHVKARGISAQAA
jgi:hypothetical protein